MSNFVALSRSALYSAMVSGQEIYVLEGDKLREIHQWDVSMSKRTARRKLAFIRESFTGEPVVIGVIK